MTLLARVFLRNRSRVFVISESNESGVSEMIRVGPLKKFYLSNGFGSHPQALLHLFFR